MTMTALQSTDFSVKDTLRSAVMTLQRAHIETASLDARLLLQHVLGVSREQLLADGEGVLNQQQSDAYQELIEKRSRRQPLSQLTGKREFWGHTFRVTGDTLDPRADTETLIESVLTRFRNQDAPLSILDMGTGTGCLLLTLLKEYGNASGLGIDICIDALQVAQENALNLDVNDRVEFRQSVWAEKLSEEMNGMFDIIVSNPPYIPTATIETLAPEVCRYEPHLALDGGSDGLFCYRHIIPDIARLLAPEGFAAIEIGLGQQRDIEHMASGQGLKVVGVREDIAGIPRCIMITHSNHN